MIGKFLSALAAALLLSAALFSVFSVSSQEAESQADMELQIVAALVRAEEEMVDAMDGYPAALQALPALIPSEASEGEEPDVEGSAVSEQQILPGVETTFTGEVEILSTGVLELTTGTGEKLLVLLGTGVLEAAGDFQLVNGTLVTVIGAWSESGSFIADILTNELTGMVLDAASIRDMVETTGTSVEAVQGQGQGQGRGQGQGYRGGQ